MNNGNTGDFDLSLLDPAALQAVQVVYGIAPSSLIGPNTIGGGINILTLEPTIAPHSLLRFFGGSYGTYGGTVQSDRNRRSFRLRLLVPRDGLGGIGEPDGARAAAGRLVEFGRRRSADGRERRDLAERRQRLVGQLDVDEAALPARRSDRLRIPAVRLPQSDGRPKTNRRC